MYDVNKYNDLTSKYGAYSSWAVWNSEKPSDTEIIDKNIDQLHSKYVLLGLNISRPLTDKPWSNFHDNSHARKLRYACNDTKLRGSYITDIFKGIVKPSSSKFRNVLTKEIISENVKFFNQEMKDISIDSKTKLIVLGTPTSLLAKLFDEHFKQNYKNEIIHYNHYSYYVLTDKAWVEGLWNILGIKNSFMKG
ncbi:MAG: hypothetical protein Q7S57_04005 [bacterium]|nr:hypothetical protein [bacterium]